ncbi:hypothetical protein K4L06_19000 [Lysobacter sp. BMK333-48F3]|uniref:hypothetical protein n=1 Tax=Lysobacter sp. BMK333-48F3 TaxID=2867962 RepID=UPI001C8B2CD5|nr:hypothetical protein [Lysobacter sp. BMK333-48F3]MBX9403407.1 hypothetical protein [Lysobacter sp. BMK333-48F3]
MKRIQSVLLLSALFALGGCEVESKSQPAAVKPALAQGAGVACPSQDFDAFLVAFMDDPAVQKAFTKRPLQSETVDADAMPEPKPVTALLDGEKLEFPLMPSTARQKQDGLALSQSESNGDKEVMLAKPDTDYQLSYFFRKGDCWTLYRMRDDSL